MPDDHTGGPRDKAFSLNDDYVYQNARVKNADEYKQQRRLESLLEARDRFLEQRDTAYEFFWEGRISRDDFLKAVRVGAEKYVLQSEWSIRNHRYSQWYWKGEPPTEDGRSPFDEDGKLRAVLPGQDLTDPETGETIPHDELSNPVLVTEGGDSRNPKENPGRTPFGTEPNILGELPMPEVERRYVFVGLESFVNADDPIVRQTTETHDHPQKLEEERSEVYTYQIPETVSKAAWRLVNHYWENNGMALDIDRGQSVISDFDMSNQPEYRHTDGRPEV